MQKHKIPKTQATEITYELHSLGWKAFQNLCVTLVGEIWGQVVQSFFDSHDGGRDGAFHGTWKSSTGELLTGAFTAQCKFTAKADTCLQLSDLKDELLKAKRLAERGLADNYILFTNARLTGISEEKIRAKFEAISGIKHFEAFGCDRISQIIRESPRLRMLVPRIYGLGDLGQILDERAYAQAQEILSALGEDLAKFVITDAYQKSAKALVEHGFVLLLGEPACGKSTIAAALAVGALDEWGCSTLKIRDANDFVKHFNPHEPKQFFWVDDAFGSTQFDWSSASDWNRAFSHVNAAIHRGARVLFTSRSYIYQAARQHLKLSSLPILNESQVVIHVENLTKDEREQILYNHIRLGKQQTTFKTKLKPFLQSVAAHPHFSPEIARRLGNPVFTRHLQVSKTCLDDFVENPLELLREVIQTLDPNNKSALALVFMRGGSLPSPIEISPTEKQAITRLGGSENVLTVFSSLDGSLLLNSLQDGSYEWRFKHPTIRDAFASLVAEDRELMDIYLAGTPIEKLFGEISCGDVGIEGVKVIVPADRFDGLMIRMATFDTKKWENQRSLHYFLAYRCCKEFLARYITLHPEFVPDLHIGSYLSVVSTVKVIVRLNQFGLLSEDKRLYVVGRIRELAVDTPDTDFLQVEIKSLLKEDELTEILEHVRTSLLPNLDRLIDIWHSSYNRDEAPEDYFYELIRALEKYREILHNDPDAIEHINSALVDIDHVIDDLRSEFSDEPDSDDYYEPSTSSDGQDDSRSVFDDVDL